MAGSVNKVILVGNLGADPEVRHTQDGRPIVNLRLATSETWRDKGSGERETVGTSAGDFGRSSALSGGGGRSFDKELDDEIPF